MIDRFTLLVDEAPSFIDGARYLRTRFGDNKKRFLERYLKPEVKELMRQDLPNANDVFDFYCDLWDKTTSFSYKEAFEIKERGFRALVFSSINVPEMIENLGSTRVKTEGIPLKNRVYNEFKGEFEEFDFDQVYELHRVNGRKLGIDNYIYAIKCWCTSTNDEHWLWVHDQVAQKNSPLEAVASTCQVYRSMLGKIKHIIRQGDVFLFEMLDDDYMPDENEEVVGLSADEYFKLLKSQS